MFAKRYFACNYFPGTYFPPICEEGASYPIREDRYEAGLASFRKQLLREDYEIIEIISSFFSVKKRLH
jgi:hypothetical protein